jgi:uncharacterized membrane protein YkvA (DUF1232 family)
MNGDLDRVASGLTREQFALLTEYVRAGSRVGLGDLLKESAQHVARTEAAYHDNPLINVKLARAIHSAIRDIVGRWDAVPHHAKTWLKGAILYFTRCSDDEPDFTSPIGFEDDAEVLNACLRFAGREDLCLNTEDYDDV